MSGGGKQTTTSVQKIPEWMSRAGEQTYGDARSFMKSNPVVAYDKTLAPGVNPTSQAAGSTAGQVATAGAPSFAAAGRMAQRATGAPTPNVGVDSFDAAQSARYMSPFVQDVQRRTVSEMQRQNEMGMDQLGDAAQGSKAFGGVRHAVEAAELGKGQNANILDYLARSNQAGFENAQSMFDRDRAAKFGADALNTESFRSDRDRELAAGGLVKDIGSSQADAVARGANAQTLAGQALFEQEKAGTDARYADWMRTQQEPWNRYAELMSMLGGAPYSRSTTETAKKGTDWLGTGLALAGTAASLISDPRLKTNIEQVGEEPDGLPIYEYDYIDHPLTADIPKSRYVGVMAPDVARLRPWALGPVVEGFATVNYARLGG